MTRGEKASVESGFVSAEDMSNLVPDFSLPFASEQERDEFERSLTDEERDLQKRYFCSLAALNWRRRKLLHDD
jgi:hypothetical protein